MRATAAPFGTGRRLRYSLIRRYRNGARRLAKSRKWTDKGRSAATARQAAAAAPQAVATGAGRRPPPVARIKQPRRQARDIAPRRCDAAAGQRLRTVSLFRQHRRPSSSTRRCGFGQPARNPPSARPLTRTCFNWGNVPGISPAQCVTLALLNVLMRYSAERGPHRDSSLCSYWPHNGR